MYLSEEVSADEDSGRGLLCDAGV